MKKIKIDGLLFELLIPSKEILRKINILFEQINFKYNNDWPLCLIVLNGATVFASKFLQNLDDSVHVSLVKLKSYSGMASTKKISIDYFPYDLVKNKNILVIEDIVDTGFTLNFLKKELKKYGAKNIECVTLLYKPKKYNYSIEPNYIGFKIENEFVVGYGMDFNEKGRDLSAIYKNIIH
ncbi:MAG: hypoxanthine phosphoribosyltransferase [Flavobacteriales bacterium]|jgi:hypoxanthine phosphoribosyltransferase|nr:hypoxanthine phosphoribosyltransferase [Flavobacteriales bacterium]|tara:strand:+ start:431 stop:970 length:540 start_codon:yes stop_codon:yes gene_type:complete